MIDVVILSISIMVICIITLSATARATISNEVWHEDIRQPTLTQNIIRALNTEAIDLLKSDGIDIE